MKKGELLGQQDQNNDINTTLPLFCNSKSVALFGFDLKKLISTDNSEDHKIEQKELNFPRFQPIDNMEEANVKRDSKIKLMLDEARAEAENL